MKKLTGYFELQSRSYPNTLAGMLEWEPMMAEDLIPALDPWVARKDISALRYRAFKDERIGTIDVRVLRGPDKNAFLAYGFLEKKTLIITSSDEVLRTLIEASTVPSLSE